MQNLLAGSDLGPPRSLTLMITSKCNLRCHHCWPESGPAGDFIHVDRDKVQAMLQNFRILGIDTIILTGGEPLLHPQWFDILSHACLIPGIKEVCLQTNATLFTSEVVRQIASLSQHNVIIQVSLDGARAKTHDRLRGVGSFNRTMGGLVRLAEHGLAEQIRVSLTETAENFEEIPLLLELLQSHGISQFVSGTLVRGGRAAKINKTGVKPPVPLQYEMLLHQFTSDQAFKEQYENKARIAPLEWYRGMNTAVEHGCRFLTNSYITAEGTLFPCVMFQVEKYAARDVYSQPIAETLEKIIPRWSELQRLSRQRPGRLMQCRTCPGRLHCRGGCMGRAYMAHGVLFAVEDRCDLRRAVYSYSRFRCQNSLSENNA